LPQKQKAPAICRGQRHFSMLTVYHFFKYCQ
jgi:hypothetical protein